MNASKILKFHIRRVTDHRIKSSTPEDFRERRVPIEGIDSFSFVVAVRSEALVEFWTDEAIAFSYVIIERGKWPITACRVKPQCELSLMYSRRVD